MPTVDLGTGPADSPTGRSSGNGTGAVATGTPRGELPERPVWEQWIEYLLERPAALSLRKLCPTELASPLLWCIERQITADDQLLILQLESVKRKPTADAESGAKHGKGKRRGGKPQRRDARSAVDIDWSQAAAHWLERFDTDALDVSQTLTAIAWAHALPKLARRTDELLWWSLLEALVEFSERAGQKPRADTVPPIALTATQLAGGELGLTLAYRFPELQPCFDRRTDARRLIGETLVEVTDGEGILHAVYFDQLREWLACWTRCVTLDAAVKQGKLARDARSQYDWLVRQALRFTRPDGSAMLASSSAPDLGFADVIAAALKITKDKEDRVIADCVLPVAKSRRTKALRAVACEPAEHSEWSETSLLQSTWDPESSRLLATFPENRFRVELWHELRMLWSGAMTTELRIDGKALNCNVNWEEVCWLSDVDVDYLELEADLDGGWRLQRQFLLAHDDEFLFWADTVLGDRSADIELSVSLPHAPNVQWSTYEETRELALRHGTTQVGLAMPLAMPEWQIAATRGSVLTEPPTLAHRAKGRAMYMPMFLDLNRSRRRKAYTWRELTVAENLKIVSRDIAVGYRVQVGDEQWLFYRSLAPVASRTVLGQNLSNDFLCARFDEDGEVEELVEIE